ncbi:MAG: thioesterase family protein [Luteimonas sp.]
MNKADKPAARKRAPRRKKTADANPSVVAADAAIPFGLIRVPLSVRWRDLDAFNHVNNSKFLSYLEEARLRWMMSLPGEWIDENVAPVVAAATINYRRPIAWPNEIVVELFVDRLGSTSLTIGHRILDASNDTTLYADGNVVMVWIDRQRGQAAALPDAVRKACAVP